MLSVAYAVVRLPVGLALLAFRRIAVRDIELLALCHEVRVLRRRHGRPAWRASDRLVLAALSQVVPRAAWTVFPVRPATLLRWRRESVRRTWAWFAGRPRPGRPALAVECRDLIRRLASENPRWGYRRIRGEPLKLGHDVSARAIRVVLRRHGLPPAPRRAGLSWPTLLRGHAGAVLACDFFAVQTIRRKTLDALSFLELRTRQVFIAGCTVHPTAEWVTQRARKLVWRLGDDGVRPTLLVRDRDAGFTRSFDDVFRSEGVRVVRTPVRAPRANAHAERWVGTVRRECLDWHLILGQRHRARVLAEYTGHDNTARPHRRGASACSATRAWRVAGSFVPRPRCPGSPVLAAGCGPGPRYHPAGVG